MKDMKTVGILSDDKENKVMEVAVPVGIVAALIPSTNPTSTVIFKALIALKAGNAIIFYAFIQMMKKLLKNLLFRYSL